VESWQESYLKVVFVIIECKRFLILRTDKINPQCSWGLILSVLYSPNLNRWGPHSNPIAIDLPLPSVLHNTTRVKKRVNALKTKKEKNETSKYIASTAYKFHGITSLWQLQRYR